MAEKVMMAMSGGVDSSVAAVILKDKGYDVTGATLRLFDGEDCGETGDANRTCCSLADVMDAKSVAARLSIPHYVFNFKERFEQNVISRFIRQYSEGGTPNPCIDCNKYIKFKELLERAKLMSQDFIATGHYCINEYDKASERYLLKRPTDRNKDQTYVLYALTQEQLAATLFPLGSLTKPQVRALAESGGFINAKKPDSQDICFVPDGKYADFIERYTGNAAVQGDFINIDGSPIGRHGGVIRYTIGQRKGLGMGFGKPVFVIEKNLADNTVVLGDEKHLFSNRLVVDEVNFIPFDTLTAPLKVKAKVRYRQAEEPALLHPLEDGKVMVEFDEPQRAITKGQAAVFYDGDIVVGGGVIV